MAIQFEFQFSVPDLIHSLLEEYMTLMNQELPGFMIAFYLHGSIALGAFIERFQAISLAPGGKCGYSPMTGFSGLCLACCGSFIHLRNTTLPQK